jgi:uncharacterized protein YutE (UPF0331/DUF86 family)
MTATPTLLVTLRAFLEAREEVLEAYLFGSAAAGSAQAHSDERGLQVCAQNALDIATHLTASAGRDAPDYASAIDVLGEVGVLPAEFTLRFRDIAGSRNVVVHGYLGVDLPRMHRLLNAGLDDFADFARCVEDYLRRI